MAEQKVFKELASRPHSAPTQVAPSKIRVIGVPLDLGQSRRGVDMGPSAVRVAGLEARLESLGLIVEDGGNLPVAIAETKKEGNPKAKYLKEIAVTCTKEGELGLKSLEQGMIPRVLGGDHPLAAGTVSGLAECAAREQTGMGVYALRGLATSARPASRA